MNQWQREKKKVQELIDEQAKRFSDEFRSLDAGCGSSSYFKLPSNAIMDGIDISAKQLERNTHLNKKVQDDLQTYVHPKDYYALIVCWDVLEHLPNPEKAVEQLFAAAKPDGLVVLAMPNINSFEAQLTKHTPQWFHTFVYRTVFNKKKAGYDDVGPFKTFLRPETSIDFLAELGRQKGMEVVYSSLYTRTNVEKLQKKSKIAYYGYKGTARIIQTATQGRIDPHNGSAIIAFRKK